MHDINRIYSHYMVDKVLEERQEQAANWRRAEDVADRAPLLSRVMAVLRWRRPAADVIEPVMNAAPTVEGA